jgi:hypothetical protein
VFRVRVLATQEEIALIAKAARKQGLSVPEFVTRVVRKLGRNLKAHKIARPRAISPRPKRSFRKKPKS